MNKHRVIYGLALTLACGLTALGCGGDKVTETNDNDPGGNPGGTAFTAKIDGQSWAGSTSMSSATGVAGTPGALGIFGSDLSGSEAVSITINLFNIKGPGYYPLGVSPVIFGGTAQVTEGANGWGTDVSGLSGTITITTLNATRVKGTFEFRSFAVQGTGATGTRTVTEGQFDLPMLVPVVAAPEGQGNSSTAMINGDPYVAWVAGVTMQGDEGFSFTSSNNEYMVRLFLTGVTAAGTYPLLSGPSSRAIIISRSELTQTPSWGATPADTGKIVVTSLTARRVKGTFNVLLKPDEDGMGATGDLRVTGSFNIGTPQR